MSDFSGSPRPPSPPRPQGDARLRFQDVGIWTIVRDQAPPWRVPSLKTWTVDNKTLDTIRIVWRFFRECFSVGPWLVGVYILASLWHSAQTAISLYLSSQILDIIQDIIVNHNIQSGPLTIAVSSSIAFSLMDAFISRLGESARNTISMRIRYLFEARLLQAHLRMDMPTSDESEKMSKVNRMFGYGAHGGALEVFEAMLSKFTGFFSVISQVGFLFKVLRTHPGGEWFVAVSIGKATMERFIHSRWWNEISYSWDSNMAYRRMNSLKSIVVDTNSRIEVISNGLGEYIFHSWRRARRQLRDLSDEHPSILLHQNKSIWSTTLDALYEDFPLVFYAYQVLRSPASFSLTSVALMQQASMTLSITVRSLMSTQQSFQQRLNDIKNIYEVQEIKNKLLDGDLNYPQPSEKPAAGMEITFENVSFAYPNSPPDSPNAIQDVSFTIRPGQTIMIVGVNGSGKSTILKLLDRLYDTSSGTIKIDGLHIQSFKAKELRRGSAMLYQNFTHFPLTIRENILMGRPDEIVDSNTDAMEQDKNVLEAARLGGSADFVMKQKFGMETVLQPVVRGSNAKFRQGSEAFEKFVKDINHRVDVSMGQWQRLALSRLFYRATSDNVKLIAVDEPSASLDPKMEYQLFENLRDLSVSKGKTLVFVTHRFGYLTKRADLILVMQDGRLVEQGKHQELLDLNGEYKKLYNVQAEAFIPSTGEQSSESASA